MWFSKKKIIFLILFVKKIKCFHFCAFPSRKSFSKFVYYIVYIHTYTHIYIYYTMYLYYYTACLEIHEYSTSILNFIRPSIGAINPFIYFIISHILYMCNEWYIGIFDSALSLFASYFNAGKQMVIINNAIRDELTTKCGVIQGTTLSPILFNIQLNYIKITQYKKSLYILLKP